MLMSTPFDSRHINQFPQAMPNIRPAHALIYLIAFSLFSFAMALAVGSVKIPWGDILPALFNPEGSATGELVLKLRLPRALAAWLTGAMLALAGCLMQVLLRNPLADPYVLGVSGGAAFAALLAISLGLAAAWMPAAAFAGALLSMITVFALARGSGPWSTARLLLTGVVMAAGWGALISLVLALSPDNSLRGMLFWLMGDLSLARLSVWIPLAFAVLLAWSLLRARSLNVLALGETSARLLGENIQGLQWQIYLVGSLLTATAVSLAGSVGFIGLIIPHLMRLAVGADHRILLPAAVLFGGSFLLLADTLARTLLAPQQLPVGVVTALTGVPMFLLLLRRARFVR